MTLKPSVVEFLEIDPTTRCNFTCSYCRGRAMPQEDLAPGLLDAALDLFPDVRFVELHGEGEALLHPDLFGLAERVRARGARVSMYTNGSLLSPAHVERLLDVGFEKVVVSVDSANPARFRELRTGKLDVVRAGLARLVQRRAARRLGMPAIGIAASLQRRYVDDLPGLVAFYRELGLDGGIGYQPINPGRSYVVNYPEAMREQIAPLAELERHVQAVRMDPVAAEAFRGTSSHRGFFDALFEPIARGEYVTTRGFVTPCCMLHEPWAIGRVGETDLSTIGAGATKCVRLSREARSRRPARVARSRRSWSHVATTSVPTRRKRRRRLPRWKRRAERSRRSGTPGAGV